MRRTDVFLLGGILLSALVIWGIIRLLTSSGAYAVVYTDGRETARYALDEERTVRIEGYAGGYNLLEIRDGRVRLTEADCPDHICVRTGYVGTNGQSIICLPHRVVISVEGKAKDVIDAEAW